MTPDERLFMLFWTIIEAIKSTPAQLTLAIAVLAFVLLWTWLARRAGRAIARLDNNE